MSNTKTDYGKCVCGEELAPEFFLEDEFKRGIPTGRQRIAVNVLSCPVCLRAYSVDDSFDGPWYDKG